MEGLMNAGESKYQGHWDESELHRAESKLKNK